MNTENTPNTNFAHNGGEQELVSHLKSIIDRDGKYSYRLDDIAAGFAAGRGVSHLQARMEIEHQFTNNYGSSPKQYMDKRYQEIQQYRQQQQKGRQDIEM